MSTPYPWIKDSQYGTTPLETGYLEVTSTNGLYLNSTTSGTNSNAILMKGFITGGSTPVTCYYYCDKLRYYPNVWGGETFLSQDMLRFADSAGTTLSQLNLSGLSCSNPNVNTYFQSSNNGQYQSIGSSGEQIYISSNGGSGNIYFTAAGLYLNGSPIGGGGGVTDIQAGSGISVNQNTGSVTITNTGGGGGGVTDIQAGPGISVNQTTGSVTITNTGGGGSYGIDYLQAGSGINVFQVSTGPNVWQIDNTGGGGGSQSLQTTLGYGNSAYSNIDMTNYDIVNVNNIATTNINSVPYRATTAFTAFNTQLISNGQIYQSGNQAYFLAGTYSITYSMTFDNNFNYNGPGNPPPYMVQGYCFLHSVNNGTDYNPNGINNAFIPGTFISNKSGTNTFINVNDTITLGYSDNYSLGCYFYNDVGLNSTMYLSAVLTQL